MKYIYRKIALIVCMSLIMAPCLLQAQQDIQSYVKGMQDQAAGIKQLWDGIKKKQESLPRDRENIEGFITLMTQDYPHFFKNNPSPEGGLLEFYLALQDDLIILSDLLGLGSNNNQSTLLFKEKYKDASLDQAWDSVRLRVNHYVTNKMRDEMASGATPERGGKKSMLFSEYLFSPWAALIPAVGAALLYGEHRMRQEKSLVSMLKRAILKLRDTVRVSFTSSGKEKGEREND